MSTTKGQSFEDALSAIVQASGARTDLWARFLRETACGEIAEIGVWKGEFAATILRHCKGIRRYYMIDPWRRLNGWNKPAKVSDREFASVHREAMERTAFAKKKVFVLRGTTVEMIDRVADGQLDFVYVDGDHTLRGITTDLIRCFPKVRDGGFIGGDDFSRTIWQHPPEYEPTFVFPFAVYFAEATGSEIYALPYDQFLLRKPQSPRCAFSFVDLTGRYDDITLRDQMRGEGSLAKASRTRSSPRPEKF